jgi:hypothetical protein
MVIETHYRHTDQYEPARDRLATLMRQFGD